ncbi:PIN domain-containing protein [Bacillus sp. 153480031-1]
MYPQYYVTLDTNILLDMLEPQKYDDQTFNSFISGLQYRLYQLVLPDIVLREWETHKEKNLARYIETSVKDLDNIISRIENLEDSYGDKNYLLKLKSIKNLEYRKYRYSYGLRARQIDIILKNTFYTEVISRTPLSDQLVVDFAIAKKTPFFQNDKKIKNEAADASIFFMAFDYFHRNRFQFEEGRYFITNNRKDFNDENNPSLPHPNLKGYLDSANLKFSNNLKDILGKDTLQLSSFISTELDESKLLDGHFIKCPKCNFEVHLTMDLFIPESKNPFDATRWLRCSKCSYSWDTGTFYVDE